MESYLEPLLPGQAFSFVEPLYAQCLEGMFLRAYLPMPKTAYDECEAVKTVVSPTQRLIVQEDIFISESGEWRVAAWLPDEECVLSFGQQVDPSFIERYWQKSSDSAWVNPVSPAMVTNVGWPEPTPESLAAQVRCLSYWIGSPLDRHRHPNPIRWRECRGLRELPLSTGVKLAVEWLSEGHYLSDPVAALRERGFEA